MNRRIGLFRGRFQPFHLAHLDVCKHILSQHPVLVVGVVCPKIDVEINELATWAENSAKVSIVESFKKENNPFSFFEVCEMIKGTLLDEGIPESRFHLVPHFPPMVYPRFLENICMPPTDEATLYIAAKGDHNIYGIDYYASQGWKVDSLTLSANISSTNIRTGLREKQDMTQYLPKFILQYIREKNI